MMSASSSSAAAASGEVVVIKVGTSSLLSADGSSVSLSTLSRIVETAVELRRQGFNVVIVSSGAVGMGCVRLGIKRRPKRISELQALAAVGQIRLMQLYDSLFSAVGEACAQVLLTFDNIADYAEYKSTRATFAGLFAHGVIPIVNENDTVAVQELKFGDNDKLSAMVSGIVRARWLFLLTDVDGMYTANPKKDASARRVPLVSEQEQAEIYLSLCSVNGGGVGGGWSFLKNDCTDDKSSAGNASDSTDTSSANAAAAAAAAAVSALKLQAAAASDSAQQQEEQQQQLPSFAGQGSQWGSGGMAGKVEAAILACAQGVATVVTSAAAAGQIPAALRAVGEGGGAATAGGGAAAGGATATASASEAEANRDGDEEEEDARGRPSTALPFGTLFVPRAVPVKARKRWILLLPIAGEIAVNAGAARSLLRSRRTDSLFAAGIVGVHGSFSRQAAVRVVCRARDVAAALASLRERRRYRQKRNGGGESGEEEESENEKGAAVASAVQEAESASSASSWALAATSATSPDDWVAISRGIVNYSSEEIKALLGAQSEDIESLLRPLVDDGRSNGLVGEAIVHRDNLVADRTDN